MIGEHVIDKSCGQLEEVFPPEGLQDLFDVPAVQNEALEHQVADLVVREGPGRTFSGMFRKV